MSIYRNLILLKHGRYQYIYIYKITFIYKWDSIIILVITVIVVINDQLPAWSHTHTWNPNDIWLVRTGPLLNISYHNIEGKQVPGIDVEPPWFTKKHLWKLSGLYHNFPQQKTHRKTYYDNIPTGTIKTAKLDISVRLHIYVFYLDNHVKPKVASWKWSERTCGRLCELCQDSICNQHRYSISCMILVQTRMFPPTLIH